MPFPFLQLYADFLISCAVLSPSTAVPGPNTSCTELNPLSTYTSQHQLLGSLSFGGMWLSLVCYKNFFQFWSKFPLKCFNIQNNLGTHNLYLFTVCVSLSLCWSWFSASSAGSQDNWGHQGWRRAPLTVERPHWLRALITLIFYIHIIYLLLTFALAFCLRARDQAQGLRRTPIELPPASTLAS